MWNALYLLYQNLDANYVYWKFSVFCIWDQNGDFPMRNIEISTFYMKKWFFSYRNTMFPVCLCFPVPWTFVCTQEGRVVCVSVCFCTWMCIQAQLMQRWRWQVTRHGVTRRRHEAFIGWERLAHASLRCSCSEQEWGKDGQWQLRRVGPHTWVYIKRHKEAHSFYHVYMCVCTRKWMGKLWELI